MCAHTKFSKKKTVYSNLLIARYEKGGHPYVLVFIAVNNVFEICNMSQFALLKPLHEFLECIQI